MYRPISVTTIPYRILAKCIAQKLSLAVPTLIGDPQVGRCPGRTYDENVRLVGYCGLFSINYLRKKKAKKM